jgi:hypothetical protein
VLIYVAHPYGGDPEQLNYARRWLAWAIQEFPWCDAIAPWIPTCEALADEGRWRGRGEAINDVVIGRCDEVWLCGPRTTPGMLREAVLAAGWGLQVRDFTAWPDRMPPRIPIMGRYWSPADFADAAIKLEKLKCADSNIAP